ncbi:hypothetical protein F5884DRAFT_850793 [Xylogone sp. PMI_703]|nr:hypothetical protein F5884DRAFT_850793 [Xylogone sp. PMI_703]
MSNLTRESSQTDEDDHGMDIDQEPVSAPSSDHGALVTLIRDSTNWLANFRSLRETDVIILLTPVALPLTQDPTDTGDPFEPLGRAIAQRHSRVRHVPYTHRNGITSTHVAFIKRGAMIVLCFVSRPGQSIPLEFADITFAVRDNRPCVIVICCNPRDTLIGLPFPTIIQTAGYSPPALEATAALIFGEAHASASAPESATRPEPSLWPVRLWDESRDVPSVCELWTQCISSRFSTDAENLSSLLRRPGYSKHYVVRDPRNDQILGFCATYLSYVDQAGEKLIASLALLLVREGFRGRGIGLSLHSHAMDQFRRTRGVVRIQLGSTFPRILYGLPFDMQPYEEWFRRRGWQLDKDEPGKGQIICDMILDFTDWRYFENPLPPTNMQFRPCTQEDMPQLLTMVDEFSKHHDKMGWFDQYSSMRNVTDLKDIVLGVENDTVTAAGITYTSSSSPVASNLPWAGRIGSDVGGLACVCILPEQGDDSVMINLLDTCIRKLREEGMEKMYVDGIGREVGYFEYLGFKKWAIYKDAWREN